MFSKIIVTSGPTREWLDPVRYISNMSSGKMGFCIAEEFLKSGIPVVFIHGPVSEKYIPEKTKNIFAETTSEMLSSVLKEIESDTVLIMAAAPADFRPAEESERKLKKKEGENFQLNLVQNPDILRTVREETLKKNLRNVILFGFAAETDDLYENALKKLEKKGIDFIGANKVGKNQGFGDQNSTLTVFSKNGKELEIIDSTKEKIAESVFRFLIEK